MLHHEGISANLAKSRSCMCRALERTPSAGPGAMQHAGGVVVVAAAVSERAAPPSGSLWLQTKNVCLEPAEEMQAKERLTPRLWPKPVLGAGLAALM